MEQTYVPRILPVVNGDFWMTMIRASAAIGYVCQGSPGSIQAPPAGIKIFDGNQYVARAIAVTSAGANIPADDHAEHFAFQIAPVSGGGNENSIREFESLLIDKFDQIARESLPLGFAAPKDFQVHKPGCTSDDCDGCDED